MSSCILPFAALPPLSFLHKKAPGRHAAHVPQPVPFSFPQAHSKKRYPPKAAEVGANEAEG